MGTEHVELAVPGMSCMHCVMAIKGALGKVPGVKAVDVDLQTKKAAVTFDPAVTGRAALASALAAAGYPPSA